MVALISRFKNAFHVLHDSITHFSFFHEHHRIHIKNSFTDKTCIKQARFGAIFFLIRI